MAENITSLLKKEALAAANALPTDVIYVVHGTGTPRDKKMTFDELRKLIGGAAGDITVNSITFTDGTSTYEMELDADGSIKSYAGFKHEGSDYTVKLAGEDGVGLQFLSGTTPAEHASVKYDKTALTLTISADNGVIIPDGVRTDTIGPKTPNTAVAIGSAGGGVNLIGETSGFNGNVKTDEILATTTEGTIVIGRAATASRAADTARFDGIAAFNNAARFDKMALFKGQFVQDIQESELDSNGGLTPAFDIAKGCVLYVTPLNIGSTLDLASLLASANYGARYTVLVNQGDSDVTYVGIGISGKKWKMTGFCGCDFVVVKQTANETVLHPVGAGQLVNT